MGDHRDFKNDAMKSTAPGYGDKSDVACSVATSPGNAAATGEQRRNQHSKHPPMCLCCGRLENSSMRAARRDGPLDPNSEVGCRRSALPRGVDIMVVHRAVQEAAPTYSGAWTTMLEREV